MKNQKIIVLNAEIIFNIWASFLIDKTIYILNFWKVDNVYDL